MRIDKAGEGGLAHRQGERNNGIAGRFSGGPGGGAAALGGQAVHIQLGDSHLIGEEGSLGQQLAVFGNEIVPGKDHIGGGFTPAGIGIEVTGHQARALPGDKGTAVFRLADGFITGGAIGQDGGPGNSVAGAGGRGYPQVLADLDRQFIFRQLPAAEQQISAEGDLLPQQGDGAGPGGGGGEPAGLVELAVIRQVGFGDDTENLSLMQHGGTVIQLAFHRKRQAGDGGEGELRTDRK